MCFPYPQPRGEELREGGEAVCPAPGGDHRPRVSESRDIHCPVHWLPVQLRGYQAASYKRILVGSVADPDPGSVSF
jgi:hypothetical protein